MSFLALLLICALVYGMLKYVVLPRLQADAEVSPLPIRVAKSGALAGCKFATDLLFLAIIVYGTFGLVALIMGSAFANNATLLRWVVTAAGTGQKLVKPVQDVYKSISFAFIVCVFLFLTWRHRRDALLGKTRLLYDLEEDRCNREREEDPSAWNALVPNEAMLAIDAEMQRIASELPKFADEKQHAERLARQRVLASLKERRNREDYARRIDQEAINRGLAAAQAEQAWYGLLSKGFYADLKLGSKVLARTATVLALLALVGLGQAAGINQILASRLVHLDDLRVEALNKTVTDEWKKGLLTAAAQPQQQDQMTAEDRAAVAYLADQFARALFSNPAWHPPTAAVSADEARHILVREAILTEVSLPTSSGESAEAYQANLSPEERDALKVAVPVDPHTTRTGQAIADAEGPQVKSWFGSHWDDVKKATAAHRAMYGDPLTAGDLRQDALDKLISSIYKGSHPSPAPGPAEPEPYWRSQSAAAGDKTMESALKEMVPTEFHRMLEDYASGTPLTEVFDHVRTAKPSVNDHHVRTVGDVLQEMHAPDDRAMIASLQENPGGWSPTRDWRRPDGGGYAPSPSRGGPPRPGAPPSGVTEVVDEVSKANSQRYSDGAVSEQQVEGLAEYEDFFPRSTASAANTVLAQEITSHATTASVAELGEDVAFRVERAASFSMLQGFSRVGGVLIGREPANPSKHLDLRGLDWSASGRDVTLFLHDADGKVTTLGPFDKSLIHQALAYAADGRPVAVTMTTANPVKSLKVQLHPSLLDTPLGCRVSQLDRLVDTFTYGNALPEREKLQESLELQLVVYDYAWSARISEFDKLSGFSNSDLSKSIKEDLERTQDLAKGLAQPSLLTKDGVMQLKPAFFDPELLSAIKFCQPAGAASFAGCVRGRFDSVELTKEIEKAWLRDTKFIPWSGVRERPFSITKDLSFLKPPSGSDPVSRLWPFDFLVQISFTTPAVNAPTTNDRYTDQEPLEFKTIRPRLQEIVDKGIQRQGLSPSLQDLRDFAVLQRLFRLALHGNLGDQFPVDRLALLEHQTAGDIPYIHTARWQRSNLQSAEISLIRFSSELQQKGEAAQPWAAATVREIRSCAHYIDEAIQRPAVTDLPGCDVSASRRLASLACTQSSGRNQDACKWSDASLNEAYLEQQLKIERAFGVLDDQRKLQAMEASEPATARRGESPCPPLQQLQIAKGGTRGLQ